VETIKTSSNKWINDQQFTAQKFDWQKGYGVFTHSKLQVDTICKYIENQEEHHKKRTFREEFIEILQRNDMEYEEKYLFEFFDDGEDE
jgi:putative transposase